MRRVEYKRKRKEKREKRVYDCLYENLHVLYFIIFKKINLYLFIYHYYLRVLLPFLNFVKAFVPEWSKGVDSSSTVQEYSWVQIPQRAFFLFLFFSYILILYLF